MKNLEVRDSLEQEVLEEALAQHIENLRSIRNRYPSNGEVKEDTVFKIRAANSLLQRLY